MKCPYFRICKYHNHELGICDYLDDEKPEGEQWWQNCWMYRSLNGLINKKMLKSKVNGGDK